MVALRSDRHDRSLVVILWVLTLAVLGVGIAMTNPILIFWGAVGVAGALFLSRIHVRDTRAESASTGVGAPGAPGTRGALGARSAPSAPSAPSAHGIPGAPDDAASEAEKEPTR